MSTPAERAAAPAVNGTVYRIALQFSLSADGENWQTVAAPVFCTSAAEEDIYARIRDLITRLPAASPPAGPGQEGTPS